MPLVKNPEVDQIVVFHQRLGIGTGFLESTPEGIAKVKLKILHTHVLLWGTLLTYEQIWFEQTTLKAQNKITILNSGSLMNEEVVFITIESIDSIYSIVPYAGTNSHSITEYKYCLLWCNTLNKEKNDKILHGKPKCERGQLHIMFPGYRYVFYILNGEYITTKLPV